jgi:hypothetical protein
MDGEQAMFVGVVVGSGVLGGLVMAWLRTRFTLSPEDTAQETLGVSVSFVTLLFSFFLGFTIVNLWQAYDYADHLIQEEANELRTLFRLAGVVDGGAALRAAVVNYTHLVTEEEWPAMTKRISGRKTDDAKDQIWREALSVAKAAQPPGLVANELLGSVVRLNKLRRDRLNLLGPSLHPLLRSAILFLAAFTLVGFFFLGGRHWKVQFLIDFIVVASVVLSVYLIQALDDPFNGTGFFINSDVFRELAQQMTG